MNDIRMTIKYLDQTVKRNLSKLVWLIVVMDVLRLIIVCDMYYSNKESVLFFHDQHIIFLSIILFVIGVQFASNSFDGYIGVYANRKSYLLTMLVYSLIFTILGYGMMRVLTLILTFGLGLILPISHQFFGEMSVIGELGYTLMSMGVGLLIGAVFYRLQPRSFVIMSLLIGYGMVNWVLSENFSYLFEQFSQDMAGGIGYGLGAFFMLGAVGMLYKAPIKKYAHNWL